MILVERRGWLLLRWWRLVGAQALSAHSRRSVNVSGRVASRGELLQVDRRVAAAAAAGGSRRRWQLGRGDVLAVVDDPAMSDADAGHGR